jgi:signal transduction histidine kinase
MASTGGRIGLGPILLGIAGSLAVLAYLVLEGPAWQGVAIVLATLFPAGLALYGLGARRIAADLRSERGELVEQRAAAERSAAESERVAAELRATNEAMRGRMAELTALNELGIALASTLDRDELIDRALGAVVANLRFDRALVLLADEERGVLGHGRSVGGSPEMAALVAGLELPLDHPESQLVALWRADGPLVFRDVDSDPFEPNRAFARALGVTSFMGTPLLAKGRPIGVLAVDDRHTERALAASDGPLLFTLGNLLAAAIENARLYAAVEEQARILEERVATRTAQLADAVEAAQAARATAEAASEAKSAFLANVSHELRTPLTSVVGFSKINRKRLTEVVFPAVVSDDPKVARAIRQVDDNLSIVVAEGDRLTALINDVLDLAKIEAGRFEWAMGPVEAGALIERATAATAALFATTGLALVVEVEPGLPTLTGDRDRLIQVLVNLLSNAVKFTPAGAVTVSAGRAGDELVVSVRDTGVGIDPADHEAVWESFRQVGDTLTEKPRGTGLGLPICREIVEAHGGRMWLESAVGTGSTFRFALPIAGAPAADDAPPG